MSIGRYDLSKHLDNKCQNFKMHLPYDWVAQLLRIYLTEIDPHTWKDSCERDTNCSIVCHSKRLESPDMTITRGWLDK